MWLKVQSTEDVRNYIRKAFWIDSRKKMDKPEEPVCVLGKAVPSEITPETMPCEIKRPVTREENELWDIVIGQWLPKLSLDEQNLIKYRHEGPSDKRRWKVIAKERYGKDVSPEAVKKKYQRTLRKILKTFFCPLL